MSKGINKRIDKVKTEHAELLNMIKEKISENSNNFQEHAKEILATLEYDEANIKKYEAMVKAQELVVSLTKQILDAKSVEEVIAIRKKLNYYINKIKGELKSREISDVIVFDYQEKANTLRKSIAEYIRFFKREENICEIERLSSNYGNLSPEELLNLRKSLTKENRYNRRNINSLKERENNPETIIRVNNSLEEPRKKAKKDLAQNKAEENFCLKKIKNDGESDIMFVTGELPYEEMSKYFMKRVDSFDKMYDIAEIQNYQNNGLGRNVLTFFRNLPRYIHNKKAIRKMLKDYFYFYRGEDLSSYIQYMKKENSISEVLKGIFDNSYLFTNEETYLNERQRCARWMYDFCQKKSATLCVRKLTA